MLSSTLPLCEIQKPRRKRKNNQITHNKTRKNTQILPPKSPRKPQRSQIPIPQLELTIPTIRIRVRIRQITNRAPQKRLRILSTCLPRGGLKDGEFRGRASDV